MRWKVNEPQVGDKKIETMFALIPVQIGGYWIFLENYTRYREFTQSIIDPSYRYWTTYKLKSRKGDVEIFYEMDDRL